MTKKALDEKRYYAISEVSKITGLEAYVLRYWEKEFPVLRPKKNRGGNRLYTAKDIELINRINHLRTREKLTIAGARTKLMMKRTAEKQTHMVGSAKIKTLAGQIRRDIEDILKFFS
ncbi:MAG: MerR family transcriptional regulator [candidate division Zixibacteria bacterium]|nr:MerR family transcriptional regulator [candidate division Zixibacteria bacterium]MDD5425428.1 MerR family transcriptional regulator [candidate division Zixibacteria bacterium]